LEFLNSRLKAVLVIDSSENGVVHGINISKRR
jgi:hypothetical protein